MGTKKMGFYAILNAQKITKDSVLFAGDNHQKAG
jgi:hypothetical protein